MWYNIIIILAKGMGKLAKFKESVFENEYLMKFVKDKDFAKTIGSSSTRKITWVCPNCKTELTNTPGHIKTRGFKCKVCADNRPYSERLMEQLLKDNNIFYVTQMKFEDCIYRSQLPFDFYLPEYNICVEMHGEQHYNIRKNSNWYDERMLFVDAIKEKYCEDNGMKYVAIDCKKSDMVYILKNIQKSELKNILTIINKKSLTEALITRILNVDVNYLIQRHQKGISFLQISEETGIDRKKIVSILKQLGVYKPRGGSRNNSKKVIRMNDKRVFNSIKEAIEEVNLKQENNIMLVCKGLRKYAGRNPETGEQYQWKYYADYLENLK